MMGTLGTDFSLRARGVNAHIGSIQANGNARLFSSGEAVTIGFVFGGTAFVTLRE